MQALLEAGIPVSAVISNVAGAAGLAIAARHGVAIEVVPHKDYPSRETFETALAARIDGYAPRLVVLAGFLRVLGSAFVEHYEGRLINIHPSLLPAFQGLATHERALAEGVKLHGCTVHFVTADLDHGPIVIQAAVPVLADDTPERLAARVLVQEHVVLPRAVRWFLDGRLELEDGRVTLKEHDAQILFSDRP